MKHILPTIRLLLPPGIALLSAIYLLLLLPGNAGAVSAQAVLLSSNPAADAVLQTPPTQVHLWFSEDLNPALSTAEVVNSSQIRMDNQDAQVNVSDSKELDLSVQANLPADVYTVVWRTDSADDGHVLSGSFPFTMANPDGTVPLLAAGVNPGQGILGNTGSGSSSTLGATDIFYLLMVVLVELGAIFWVGAQFWLNFVLQNVSEKHQTERALTSQIEQRFERRFSLPTLLLLLLANLGLLYGQVLYLTGGNWGAAFSGQLLSEQISGGHFGAYWLMRLVVLLLALALSLFMLVSNQRSRAISVALPLVNLFLGAMLFVAMTMSGDAGGVESVMLPYAIVLDWLHLIAAALWIGGMLYIYLIYLPTMKGVALPERARSLLAILPQYAPLAVAGVVIMAISGPLTATFHLTSVDQFLNTAYGRTLLIKILLICVLLATSGYQIFWLRPRLKKEYQKYTYATDRLAQLQVTTSEETPEQLALASISSGVADLANVTGTERNDAPASAISLEVETPDPSLSSDETSLESTSISASTSSSSQAASPPDPAGSHKLLAHQVRLREGRLNKKVTLITRLLRWEPWLGVAIIICVGLMNIFLAPLAAANALQQQQQQNSNNNTLTGPFKSTAKTSDGAYNVTLSVSPNRFGTNVFTVQIASLQTGQTPNLNGTSVTLYTTMLDMNMGTDSINLPADGKGSFSASQTLSMAGNWGVEVQVHTPDNELHKVTFKIVTPF